MLFFAVSIPVSSASALGFGRKEVPLMGIDHFTGWFGEAWSSEPSAGEHYVPQGFELYA